MFEQASAEFYCLHISVEVVELLEVLRGKLDALLTLVLKLIDLKLAGEDKKFEHGLIIILELRAELPIYLLHQKVEGWEFHVQLYRGLLLVLLVGAKFPEFLAVEFEDLLRTLNLPILN
jgi:hypothetical protein